MKSYLFCSILESSVVGSEMKVVLRCENYVQANALTALISLLVARRLLLSSRVSPLVINLFTIRERVFQGRTIRKLMGGGGGAGEVQKKYSRQGKLNDKKFLHTN